MRRFLLPLVLLFPLASLAGETPAATPVPAATPAPKLYRAKASQQPMTQEQINAYRQRQALEGIQNELRLQRIQRR